MGEQDFTIMSSKNQQAFDSKINKISEKKKYSWRQGLYNNKINLNWQTGNYNLNRKKKLWIYLLKNAWSLDHDCLEWRCLVMECQFALSTPCSPVQVFDNQ